MYDLESFKIDLKDLKEGESTFHFQLTDEYFAAIEAAEIQRGKLVTDLSVRRVEDFYELNFHTEGTVYVPCDVCLDDLEIPVKSDDRLVAKFGEEYSEDDDLVTVAENEGMLDVAWFIYEFIELQIPIKHVHAPGKCNPAMISKLEEHTVARSDEDAEDKPIDPRWAALLKLKE